MQIDQIVNEIKETFNDYFNVFYEWFKPNVLNEYGLAVSFIFLLAIFVLITRVTSTRFLIFRLPEDISFPLWVRKILDTSNAKTGLINLILGVFFIVYSIYSASSFAEIIGFIAIGIGIAFLSFNAIHDYVMPGTKKILVSKTGKYVFVNAVIMSWIIYYFFIDYFQLVWKTLAEEPNGEGLIRYLFYYTSIATWKFMIPLMLMHLGRNRVNVLNVIFLSGFSLWFAYDFFDYLADGGKQIDGSIFLLIASFCITTFGIWHRREEKKRLELQKA